MIKITIIIPVFKTEEWLQECLMSIKKQSFKSWEAIVIDDASPYNAGDIAQKFCVEDSRFQLIQLDKNIGLGGARNIGCRAAKGEYLFFLDSDDLLPHYTLELMYDAVRQYDADLIIGDFLEFEDGGSVPSLDYPIKAPQHFSSTFEILGDVITWDDIDGNYDLSMPSIYTTTCCGKLFRKALWKSLGCHSPGDLRMAEDFIPVKKFIFHAQKIVPLDLSVLFYRKRKGSATTKRDIKAYEVLRSYDLACKEFKLMLGGERFKELFEMFYIRSIRDHMYNFLSYIHWFSYYRKAAPIIDSLRITNRKSSLDGINLEKWASKDLLTFLKMVAVFLRSKVAFFFRSKIERLKK